MLDAWDDAEQGGLEEEQASPDDAAQGRCEVIEVARKLRFSFDGDPGKTQEIVLASGVDVSRWADAALEVIVHGKNSWGGDNTMLTVAVRAVALNPLRPAVDFLGAELASVRFFEGLGSPYFEVAGFAATCDSVRVSLVWLQEDNPMTPQWVDLTVRLIGRFM